MRVPSDLLLPEDLVQPRLQALGHGISPGVDTAVGNRLQHGGAGDGRPGLGIEGAALRHAVDSVPLGVSPQGHELHDVSAAADRPARLTAGDDLGHGAQIGLDTPAHLRSTGRQAESRDHLIHNKDDAVPGGDLPHVLQELRVRQGVGAIVRAVALDDDGRDVVIVRQHAVHRGGVSRRHQDLVQARLRHAAQPLARLGGGVVVPAVVVLVKLHQLGLAGIGTGQAQRQVGGLRARARKPYPFQRGHEALHRLRIAHLVGGRAPEMRPAVRLGRDGLRDVGGIMTHKQAAVAHHIVDELVPVHVILVGAFGVLNVGGKRRREPGLVRDAARKERLSPLVPRHRLTKLLGVTFCDRGHSSCSLATGSGLTWLGDLRRRDMRCTRLYYRPTRRWVNQPGHVGWRMVTDNRTCPRLG